MDIRPIRTETDYDRALVLIDDLLALIGDAEPQDGSVEADRLAVLTALVHDYESRYHAIAAPDPIEAIKFRMDQAGLTRRDLEAAIGSDGRVSEILNRKRPLTLPMIRRLNALFGIPAESLIREYPVEEPVA